MTAPTAAQKNVFIGNAHLARQQLRVYAPSTDSFTPFSGPATVALCTQATDPTTGEVTYTPIGGLGPFVMTSAVAGVYFYEFATSAIAALNMPPYLNQVIYQVVIGGANNELQDVQPLLVCPSRYPL